MKLNRRVALTLLAGAMVASTASPNTSHAATAGEINAGVRSTLNNFYAKVRGGRGLVSRAAGVLVFPSVVKAGFGVGGSYGEGAMLVGGHTSGYYNTVSASVGFQLGAQTRSVIILFMTQKALKSFYRVDGFTVGVDGSVTIVNVGASGSVDTEKLTQPVLGFILDAKGLMYNLTLEGSKISRIKR